MTEKVLCGVGELTSIAVYLQIMIVLIVLVVKKAKKEIGQYQAPIPVSSLNCCISELPSDST